MKRVARTVSSLILLAVLAFWAIAQSGQPPEIGFIDFPTTIQADGKPVVGLVGFNDLDGDLARAEFKVIDAQDFQSFTLDLTGPLKGQKDGVFSFEIATTTSQRIVLEVTLVDAQSLRSQPQRFSFEAVGGQPPPPSSSPRLQVEPTQISFQAQVNGPDPADQLLTIRNTGAGTLNWNAQTDTFWVVVNTTSGSIAAGGSYSLQVQVRVAGLSSGTHQAQITVTAPGSENSPASVRITLTLSSQAAPPRPVTGNPLFITSNGASFTTTGNGRVFKLDISSPLIPLKMEIVRRLDSPGDAVCGSDGRVYFADVGSGKVYRVDQDGRNLVELASLVNPEGVAFDAVGDLYINSHDGIWRFRGGEGPADRLAPALSERVGGLVFLTQGPYVGDLVAVDAEGNRVLRFPAPNFDRAIDFIIGGLEFPLGIAINGQGDVFVGNFTSKKIQHYASDGAFVETLGERIQLRPYRPIHMEFGPDDTLYVAEWGDVAGQGWVARISTAGELTLITALVDAWGVGIC